jgi:hypothetical protein
VDAGGERDPGGERAPVPPLDCSESSEDVCGISASVVMALRKNPRVVSKLA